MPDFSLIFFGAIILSGLVYVIRCVVKSQSKKESILNLLLSLLLAFSINYVILSNDIGTAFLFPLSILVILLFIITFFNYMLDFYLVRACVARALKKIHTLEKLDIADIFKINQSFLYSDKVWYIAYSKVNGCTIIGVNIYNDHPCANKSFTLKTLNGEFYDVCPLNSFIEETVDKVCFVFPLKEFYNSGKENQKIVYDYLLTLKNKKC